MTRASFVGLLFATVLGGAGALAFAPLFILPIAPVALAGLVILLFTHPSGRAGFALAWAFGLGNFVVGLNWITESFRFADENLAPFAIPALIGLSAFLAVFPGLAGLCTVLIARNRRGKIIAFPAFWTLAEFARGSLFTGFPWNLTGYVWGISDETMQIAAFVGPYGLSFITVAISSFPLLLIGDHARLGQSGLIVGASFVFGAASLWAGGSLRLSEADVTFRQGFNIRLVQGNIPQDVKWDARAARSILDRYLSLSASPGVTAVTHIIWPETSLPYLFQDTPELLNSLTHPLPTNASLTLGATRASPDQAQSPAMLNSIIVINAQRGLMATYDKQRLVPFGEYMPLKAFLPIKKMTDGTIDYVAGQGARTLKLPGLPPAAPLICYEAVFPTGGTPRDNEWLLNVTNDAWFGTSWGPYQHFLTARFRAVETGVPLIRVANTGISAVVDSYGRILQSLPLGLAGTIDTALPYPVAPTLFSRVGNALVLVMIVTNIVLAARRRSLPPEIGGRV